LKLVIPGVLVEMCQSIWSVVDAAVYVWRHSDVTSSGGDVTQRPIVYAKSFYVVWSTAVNLCRTNTHWPW